MSVLKGGRAGERRDIADHDPGAAASQEGRLLIGSLGKAPMKLRGLPNARNRVELKAVLLDDSGVARHIEERDGPAERQIEQAPWRRCPDAHGDIRPQLAEGINDLDRA